MKKQYHLRRPQDFGRARQEGRSWANSLLALCVIQNDLPYSRFGFTASKHVGKAVVRNRAKRLMREAVRLKLPAIQSGFDMVFIARKPMEQADYHQVDQAIQQLFRQAHVLKKDGAQGGEAKA